MEKLKKKNGLKKGTKRKQKDTERTVDDKNSSELVEPINRKQSKAEKKLSGDPSKPGQVKKLKQKTTGAVTDDYTQLVNLNEKVKSKQKKISDNLLKSDNVKKKKRKLSSELTGDVDRVNTNIDQQPKKKKKNSKKLCDQSEPQSGHVLEQKSPKHLSVIASDSLHSDDSEKDHMKKHSPQVKKGKKRKQKEDHVPEGDLDDSEEDTCAVVPKKKKDKKKNKKKNVEGEDCEDTSISAQTAAIDYLKAWSEDTANWKFQKVRQVWLLQHMYDDSKVPDTDFDRLLLYLENLKGKAKEETLNKASKIIEAEDSSSDEDDNAGEKTVRARQVMQMLN